MLQPVVCVQIARFHNTVDIHESAATAGDYNSAVMYSRCSYSYGGATVCSFGGATGGSFSGGSCGRLCYGSSSCFRDSHTYSTFNRAAYDVVDGIIGDDCSAFLPYGPAAGSGTCSVTGTTS